MPAATIDYEKEYDNRGRVPEHPEIFARWEARDQGLSRGAAGRRTGPSYGPSPRQTHRSVSRQR